MVQAFQFRSPASPSLIESILFTPAEIKAPPHASANIKTNHHPPRGIRSLSPHYRTTHDLFFRRHPDCPLTALCATKTLHKRPEYIWKDPFARVMAPGSPDGSPATASYHSRTAADELTAEPPAKRQRHNDSPNTVSNPAPYLRIMSCLTAIIFCPLFMCSGQALIYNFYTGPTETSSCVPAMSTPQDQMR